MGRDVAWIEAALRRTLASGERITGVCVMSTGHSNETYLIEGLDLILRMPPSGAPLLDGLDMARQFQIYAVMGRMEGAPPVPRVLYLCEDETVLGAPFYLVERVCGEPLAEYEIPGWFADAPEAVRDSMSRQYVEAYAGLASLEPLDLLGPVRTPIDECLRWRGFAQASGQPTLVAAIDRLIALPHRRSGPPAPINGDAKMGNLLWRDGRLTAMLDWELAINGEPLAELGYMLYFFESERHPAALGCDLPGMWRRDRVIAEWERATGRSAQGIEWYEAAAGAKIAAIMAYGYHLTQSGQSDDPRMAAWLPTVEQWTAMTIAFIDSMEDMKESETMAAQRTKARIDGAPTQVQEDGFRHQGDR
ncbi:MAG: phosphotransferase family protein [Sphingobium sp.]